MKDEIIKQKIVAFLDSHNLGVISTVHKEKDGPESALVGVANTESLDLVFGTANTTRKYQNIQANPHISFVVGWDAQVGSVQYEGVARELAKDEAPPYIEIMTTRNPYSKKFAEDPHQRYFLVTPTWIRLIDNAGTPPDIYELTF
jgi:general stress protein 26